MTFGLGVALGWILGILSGLWAIHGIRQELLDALAKLRAAEAADLHDMPGRWVQVDRTPKPGGLTMVDPSITIENLVCMDGVWRVRGHGKDRV